MGGDLVAAGDKKSALFTAHAAGSAAIHVVSGSLTSNDSGLITVAQPPAPPPPPPPPSGGGGGGGGGPSTPPSVAGVTNLANVVDAKGIFSLEVDAWSDNKKVVLVIGGNTAATPATGTTLTQISLLHADTVPAFITGANAIGLAYDFQPAGITFNPAVIVRFNYDPKLIPDGVDENSLQIAYYDNAANVWVPLPSTIDINNKFITAPISHFSTYAVTYGVKMPAPVQTTTTAPVIITTPLLITTPTTTMPVATTTAAPTTKAPVTTSTTTTAPAEITATTQTAAVTSTNVAPLSANSSINTLPEQTTSRLQTSPSPASKATAPVWLFVIIGIAVLVGCLIITLLVSRRRG